jgi:peptidyl-dipeptidase Dcp
MRLGWWSGLAAIWVLFSVSPWVGAFGSPCDPLARLPGELATNPLLIDRSKIHWSQIQAEHFLPAIRHEYGGFQEKLSRIVSDPSQPTFENTVFALEEAGEAFSRILGVYSVYVSNHNTQAIREIQDEINGLTEDYMDLIFQNERVYSRISSVHGSLQKGTEEFELTERWLEGFTERGIHLDQARRSELARVHRRLGVVEDQFERNLLVQANSIQLKVRDLKELGGLPSKWMEEVKALKGADGCYWIPLKNEVLIQHLLENVRVPSFLKKVYYADFPRAISQNYLTPEEAGEAWSVDNRSVLLEIVDLRQRLAGLLGGGTYADQVLKGRMAGSVDRVRKFYEDLIPGVLKLAERERKELFRFAQSFDPMIRKIEPWDRARYLKWLYDSKYAISEDQISEYFEVNHTVKTVFDFYGDLFNLRFERIPGAETWHPEVDVYRVIDTESKRTLAEIHLDLYSRETKTGGAWMAPIEKGSHSSVRTRSAILSVSLNLDRALGGKPTLLRLDDVSTLFHELGHAMHEAFSGVRHASLAGTAVTWDFVEFPSQIMENWLYTPEFLKKAAIHHQSHMPMPRDWLKPIQESAGFRMGTRLRSQILLGLVDVHWHTTDASLVHAPADLVDEIERGLHEKNGFDYSLDYSPISPSFSHIFSGGYAMGYYSYLWANMIEADGFEYWYSDPSKVKEKALRLKSVLLSKGAALHPDELYRAWTGRDYSVNAFLKRSGLSTP